MGGPLVTADLTLEHSTGTVRIVGRGRELVAELPGFRSAWALARARASFPADVTLPGLAPLRLEAWVRQWRVATLDPARRAGRVARRFGVTRLHPSGLAAAALSAIGVGLRRVVGRG